ncbi:MAG: helix-turn-helix domain-containing protein [Pseudobdellovibrionaceae bacterium]
MEKLNLLGSVKSDPLIIENRIACEWLSSFEASSYLGSSENALRIMVYRRQVKFAKFGRRLRFRFSDLQLLLTKELK